MKKRLLSMLLVLTMLLSLFPAMSIGASAADEATLKVNASTGTDDIDRNNNAVYKTVAGALAKAENGDTIQLESSITENVTIPSEKTVTLDLNGFVLQGDGTSSVIVNNGTLTIQDSDSTKEHKFGDNNGLWVWDDTLTGEAIKHTVTGGVITGGKATRGGGVNNTGTLTINSGYIVGCTAGKDGVCGFGGGICNQNNCTLNMFGGTVVGNKAVFDGFIGFPTGGGVLNYGTMTVGGDAVITGNYVLTTIQNLYIDYSSTIFLATGTNALKSGASIGVTLASGTGVFSNADNTDYSTCFSSDNAKYKAMYNADKELELGEPPVCKNGETKYPSIADALAAAHNSEDSTTPTVITLIADDTENVTIDNGRYITLDLNDHVLSAESGTIIINNGDLTITDSKTENRTTRYFTDSKCQHGIAIGEVCGNCDGGTAVKDGCYETYLGNTDATPNAISVTGGVITGGDETGYTGGAIRSYGLLSASHINFVGNKSLGRGGAVYMDYCELCSFSDVVVAGNLSAQYGGGVFTQANENHFDHCRFINNLAHKDSKNSCEGGAICSSLAGMHISDSLFEGNMADWAGSAISSYGFTELKNVTVKNNHITDNSVEHCGGAVFVETGDTSSYEEKHSHLYLDGEIYIADNTFGDDKVPSNVILISPPAYETSLQFGEDFALKDEDQPIGIMLTSDDEWDYLPMVGSLSDVCSAGMAELFYAEGNAFYQNNGYYVKYDTDHLVYAKASVIIDRGITNGKIKVDDQEADSEESITVTAIPDEGYKPDKITVRDKNGDDITANVLSGTTITVPAAEQLPITVSAVFKKTSTSSSGGTVLPKPEKSDKNEEQEELPEEQEPVEEPVVDEPIAEEPVVDEPDAPAEPAEALDLSAVELPFIDVGEDGWYFDAVRFVYALQLMNGVSATEFAPNATTTRAMVATILWRLAGSPAVLGNGGFDDVEMDKWYTTAIAWAAKNGIVTGYDEHTFGPNDPITREQLVAILYRLAVLSGVDVSVGEDTNILSYDDIFDVSEYAISAFQWACGADVIQGVDGFLLPRESASRAQIATLLMRVYEMLK